MIEGGASFPVFYPSSVIICLSLDVICILSVLQINYLSNNKTEVIPKDIFSSLTLSPVPGEDDTGIVILWINVLKSIW